MTLLLSRDKIVIMKTPKELEYARKKGLVFRLNERDDFVLELG